MKFLKLSHKKTVQLPKFGGTGLGLTISNKLLGLMSSHLNLISEIGVEVLSIST
jgi:signal transduction histidine kinase